MRNLHELDRFRVTSKEVVRHFGNTGNEICGFFQFKSKRGEPIRIVASSAEGWDHISVSLQHRCPTWEEMERVKRLFFLPGEAVMQLHVPETEHISYHNFCLHLWRPIDEEIPMPPAWMVGPLYPNKGEPS